MRDLEEIKNLGYFSISLAIVVLVIGITRFMQLKIHLKKIYEPNNNQQKNDIPNK